MNVIDFPTRAKRPEIPDRLKNDGWWLNEAHRTAQAALKGTVPSTAILIALDERRKSDPNTDDLNRNGAEEDGNSC